MLGALGQPTYIVPARADRALGEQAGVPEADLGFWWEQRDLEALEVSIDHLQLLLVIPL